MGYKIRTSRPATSLQPPDTPLSSRGYTLVPGTQWRQGVIEAQRYLHPQQASSERPGHWPQATSAGATALRAARTRLRGLKYAYAPAHGGEVERAERQARGIGVRRQGE